jgi:hypothetical protein
MFPTKKTLFKDYAPDAIDSWPTVGTRALRDCTIHDYKTLVENYLNPRFGDLALGDLTPAMLQEVIDDPFLGKTRSPETKRKFLRLVERLFDYAYKRNLLNGLSGPYTWGVKYGSLYNLRQEIRTLLAKIEAKRVRRPKKITFAKYAKQVLHRIHDDPARSMIRRPRTLSSHLFILKNHLAPTIGNVPVNQLTDESEALQELVRKIAQEPIQKTRQNRIQTLWIVLTEAVVDRHLQMCPSCVSIPAITHGQHPEESGYTPLFAADAK